ncbi:hypothetical protein [Haloarcula sp. Atlit-120R]|uniref:hypothetical protein n=1 Tax=Haloarcula sp. Atlit-120R TaxID=2282135 RepID=UPI0011C3A7B4|nr:hypothetical protein [Haloarcula sp. Atlit-120R]
MTVANAGSKIAVKATNRRIDRNMDGWFKSQYHAITPEHTVIKTEARCGRSTTDRSWTEIRKTIPVNTSTIPELRRTSTENILKGLSDVAVCIKISPMFMSLPHQNFACKLEGLLI